MKCSQCDHINPDHSTFCGVCGKPLAIPANGQQVMEPGKAGSRLPLALAIVCVLLVGAVGAMGYLLLRDDGSYDDDVISMGGGEETGTEATGGGARQGGGTVSRGSGTATSDKLPAVLSGTVVESGRRSIKVKAEHNDRVYVVAVGLRTKYSPRRRAAVGDRVAVNYHFRRGHLIGDKISYR